MGIKMYSFDTSATCIFNGYTQSRILSNDFRYFAIGLIIDPSPVTCEINHFRFAVSHSLVVGYQRMYRLVPCELNYGAPLLHSKGYTSAIHSLTHSFYKHYSGT